MATTLGVPTSSSVAQQCRLSDERVVRSNFHQCLVQLVLQWAHINEQEFSYTARSSASRSRDEPKKHSPSQKHQSTPASDTSAAHHDNIPISNLCHCFFSQKVVIPRKLPSAFVPQVSCCSNHLDNVVQPTCSRIRPSSNSPFSHSLFFPPGVLEPLANRSALSSGLATPLPSLLFSHSSTSSPTSRFRRSFRCSRRSDWKVRIREVVVIAVARAVRASV